MSLSQLKCLESSSGEALAGVVKHSPLNFHPRSLVSTARQLMKNADSMQLYFLSPFVLRDKGLQCELR